MAVPPEVRQRFGALIRNRRTGLNPPIPQRVLAETVHTTQAAISQFEKGVTFPSAETFYLLLQALAIDMSEVLEILADARTGVQPLVLTPAETAIALGISERYVLELIGQGRLPCVTWGRKKVVPKVAVDMILAEPLKGFDPRKAMEGCA